jgi:hypothetical protein
MAATVDGERKRMTYAVSNQNSAAFRAELGFARLGNRFDVGPRAPCIVMLLLPFPELEGVNPVATASLTLQGGESRLQLVRDQRTGLADGAVHG